MKKLVTSYAFDASAKTITAADFAGLENIQLITNVTDNIIIYNFADADKGGTLAGTVLTLDHDTTAMDDADKLQIFVDDGAAPATSAHQVTQNGYLDGIEALLGVLAAAQVVEDAASAGGETMMLMGGIRRDADTSSVGADGDFHAFHFNQYGRLKASVQAAAIAATTGNFTAAAQSITCDVARAGGVVVQVTGVYVGLNFIFEGSVDGGTTWFTVQAARTDSNTIETTSGVLGSTTRAWELSTNGLTNFRVRSTAYTSGTGAITILPSALPTEPIPAIGAHAVTGSGNFAVTMAAGATASPAKARDGVAGATDTGIPAFFVRRDTPTAVTPAAGDFEIPQISANGEQWVRMAGELADDSAFTPGTTRVLPTGYVADETSTDSVDEGDAGAARMTLDRKQIVVPEAHTNGGATPYKLISAASTNSTNVKGSAGQVYSLVVTNINAAVRYLKLYNKATAPTVGTDVPVQTYAIPGATTGGGFTLSIPVGMEFPLGIGLALTTGAADTDTGGVAAAELIVNLTYK